MPNLRQRWGFSKLGPVFYDPRDGTLSSRRKDEIEEEVTKSVASGSPERSEELI
jgi:ATP-dependent metalloprotease